MATTKYPESARFIIASRFEKELESVAQDLSFQHQNWRAAAEPDWDPRIGVIVRPGTHIPPHLTTPRARTFEQLVFPKPLQTGLPSILASLILVCSLVAAGWFALGAFWGWAMSWGGDSGGKIVLNAAFVALTAYSVKKTYRHWRENSIVEDARTAVSGRAPFLNDVILLNDLDLDSRELLDPYLDSGDVRPETAWAAAQLLLEADADRRVLARYKKLLPADDSAHPLHEVLGNIRQRINTRLHTIATRVADDVAAAAQTSEAAK